MKRFLSLPIRVKLLCIILLTSVVALMLSMIMVAAYDAVEYTDQRIRELNTQAAVIGNLSTAALAFNDPKSATEYLTVLKWRKQIASAALYKPDGKIFASYAKNGEHSDFPPAGAPGYRIHDGELDLFYPIEQNAETIGLLYLHSHLERSARIMHLLGVLLLAALVSLAFSLWISNKLQSTISKPILEIAAVAKAVINQKNYGLRAAKYNPDEIGLLAEAFNQMLFHIQERDADILKTNTSLKKEIDARKTAQASLKKNIEELARSNSELEQFAYVSSHDLQEPLRMIASYTQLIEKQYAATFDAKGHVFLNYIVDGAKRMQQLIDDLLMFSRVGTRGKELRELNLQIPLNLALHNLEPTISETGAHINTVAILPHVIGDSVQLIQLFQNLINNAIKFRSSHPLEIQINATKLNEFLEITVKDNGIGIEQGHFSRIFVIFQRLHGRSEYPGSGIGLAICKKIVERHGGEIWLESEVGVGTTFHFTLRGAPA